MGRIHFFELEDQEWFPATWRNYGTDYLQFISNTAKMYKSVVPIIQKGLDAAGNNQIIDLASGGGGGLLWLNAELLKTNPDLKILLTDYFPNITAFERTKKVAGNFDYISSPVDARDVPPNLKGLRTQFLSFHHFKPRDARLILQNAIDTKIPIAIFEVTERSIPSLISAIFSPIAVLLLTPFIRPFSIGRLFFTYLIPIIPLFVMFDGIVSCLRTYSVKEMNDIIDRLENKDSFTWDIGKAKTGPAAVSYLLGVPK